MYIIQVTRDPVFFQCRLNTYNIKITNVAIYGIAYNKLSQYMTGLRYLEIHKNNRERFTDLKFSEIIKGMVVLQSLKFYIYLSTQIDFMNHSS